MWQQFQDISLFDLLWSNDWQCTVHMLPKVIKISTTPQLSLNLQIPQDTYKNTTLGLPSTQTTDIKDTNPSTYISRATVLSASFFTSAWQLSRSSVVDPPLLWVNPAQNSHSTTLVSLHMHPLICCFCKSPHSLKHDSWANLGLIDPWVLWINPSQNSHNTAD